MEWFVRVDSGQVHERIGGHWTRESEGVVW